VKFKPVAGKKIKLAASSGACQDSNNYYISRANALEDNVTLTTRSAASVSAFKASTQK